MPRPSLIRVRSLTALAAVGALGAACLGPAPTGADAPEANDDVEGAAIDADGPAPTDLDPDGVSDDDAPPADSDPDAPDPDAWTATPQAGLEIDIEAGRVLGEDDGNLRIFKGIPFAEPPLGAARFRPPMKVEPWDGVRDATAFGPVCPQMNLPDLVLGDGGMSEDCLSVNVWAHDDGNARPVMVFIYGGAFILGASSQPMYDGAALARRGDVTVVSFNYRLGALGWLASPHLAEDAGEPAAGNWGLHDQIEALRWVKANIAAFGGDPDNVTIFGESAGAISVCALLGAPEADPLFEKAIIESGMCALSTYDEGGLIGMPSASELSEAFVEEVGCADAFSVADCLRATPADDLVAATSLFDLVLGDLEAVSALSPIVDGAVLPAQPIDRLRAGEVDKPIIVGSMHDEGLLFTSADVVLSRGMLENEMQGLLGEGPHVDALLELYPSDDFFFPKDAWVALLGEATFICPGLEVARTSRPGAEVYAYHFTHTPLIMAGIGAMHGLDLPYVFGTFGAMGLIPSNADEDLSDAIQGAWSSFARYGSPSMPTGWDAYDDDDPRVLVLDDDLATVDEIRDGRCAGLREIGIVY